MKEIKRDMIVTTPLGEGIVKSVSTKDGLANVKLLEIDAYCCYSFDLDELFELNSCYEDDADIIEDNYYS